MSATPLFVAGRIDALLTAAEAIAKMPIAPWAGADLRALFSAYGLELEVTADGQVIARGLGAESASMTDERHAALSWARIAVATAQWLRDGCMVKVPVLELEDAMADLATAAGAFTALSNTLGDRVSDRLRDVLIENARTTEETARRLARAIDRAVSAGPEAQP